MGTATSDGGENGLTILAGFLSKAPIRDVVTINNDRVPVSAPIAFIALLRCRAAYGLRSAVAAAPRAIAADLRRLTGRTTYWPRILSSL
jgi:hypothetical protein